MKQRKNKQFILMITLAVVVTLMAVGFAATAYTQTLNINGNVTVKAAKWDIHFDSTSYAESIGSVQATSHTLNNTTWNYTVTLTKPGDFYEASVNVVNRGTFNAMINGAWITGLEDAENFISYSMTYDSKVVVSSDNVDAFEGIENSTGFNPLVAQTGSHTVKIRIEYVQPEQSHLNDVANDVQLTVTAGLSFIQVEGGSSSGNSLGTSGA